MRTTLLIAGVLAAASLAVAIPPVGPGGQGRLSQPRDIRIFEPGRQYRLTHSSETTMPMGGMGGTMTFAQIFSVDVAPGPGDGALAITMRIERVILARAGGGHEEVLDSTTAEVDHPMVEMIGVDFNAVIDASGEMTEFAITDSGRQGLALAQLGRNLESLVPSYGLLLRDCLYYVPPPTAEQGDSWNLTHESGPGLNLFLIVMMGGLEQPALTGQSACVLESLGGDGTPTTVTFADTQEIVPTDNEETIGVVAEGRAVFDPEGDASFSLLRRAVLTPMAGGGRAMPDESLTIVDRIVLTDPDVDAPPREELPDNEPTTQPAE